MIGTRSLVFKSLQPQKCRSAQAASDNRTARPSDDRSERQLADEADQPRSDVLKK